MNINLLGKFRHYNLLLNKLQKNTSNCIHLYNLDTIGNRINPKTDINRNAHANILALSHPEDCLNVMRRILPHISNRSSVIYTAKDISVEDVHEIIDKHCDKSLYVAKLDVHSFGFDTGIVNSLEEYHICRMMRNLFGYHRNN